MLLPGLHRHPEGGFAAVVNGDPDNAAGHAAGVLVRGGHEGRVRAAKAHGHPEPLGRPDANVGAPGPGRLKLGQGHEVARAHHQGAHPVRVGHHRVEALHHAVSVGVLHQHSRVGRIETGCVRVTHHHLTGRTREFVR